MKNHINCLKVPGGKKVPGIQDPRIPHIIQACLELSIDNYLEVREDPVEYLDELFVHCVCFRVEVDHPRHVSDISVFSFDYPYKYEDTSGPLC